MRRLLLAGTFVFASLLCAGAHAILVARTGFAMGDFRAFYCAARVVAEKDDPYRAIPLHACEIAVGAQAFFDRNHGVTVPAPLPGYVIAALIPLSLLPFGVASSIWLSMLLLASITCVIYLSRLAGVSWTTSLAAVTLALVMTCLAIGEIVPIAIAAICICAYCARYAKWPQAAIAAAMSAVEPHLGLPVCLALALWAPASRITLAAALSALAALSLLAIGPAANAEYLTGVLPAHALSEVARDTQFSATSVFAALGVGASIAIRLGEIWYFAMIVAGAICAGFLARTTQDRAFLACVPPAFAVFGGVFVHVTEIAAAIPAAMLLAAHARGLGRTLAIVGLLLLSVPWIMAWSPAMGIAPAVPIAYLAWRYWNADVRAVAFAGIAAFALLVGLNVWSAAAANAPRRAYSSVAIEARLSEASWSEFSRKNSTSSIAAFALRVPTWSGLLIILTLLARRSDLSVEVS